MLARLVYTTDLADSPKRRGQGGNPRLNRTVIPENNNSSLLESDPTDADRPLFAISHWTSPQRGKKQPWVAARLRMAVPIAVIAPIVPLRLWEK